MSDPTITIGLTVTAAGAQPTPPAVLWANLIAMVAQINPGYTVLPGGLIEDLASTATYAVAQMDAAAVETLNSLTPFGANAYLLTELGNIYGVAQGSTTNTSVFVVFSGTVGVQIPPGFLVSDGSNQYQVQEGTVIGAGGSSDSTFCVATQSGSWAVPANSVTTLITSAPLGASLTVTNPQAGTPSVGAETQEQYAARVLQAGLVTAQGAASFLKTALAEIPGVQPRLISVQLTGSNTWEVICGGGDPYAIANAIYYSGLDLSTLTGSTIAISAITKANPGVVTCSNNHELVTGQANVYIASVLGMTAANGGPYTVTVLDEKRFSFGVNTTGFATYTGGGVVTPNARNISVDLNDYPDTYEVPFVNPPPQTVILQLTWDTISPNFVSATAVSQLGTVALVNYINSIPVGAPINLLTAQGVFINAVAALFNNNVSLISELDWTVSINGIATVPAADTELIYGDPESYFQIVSTAVTITQG